MSAFPDEFVCDMAEIYGVLDWRALPIVTAATLAQGLPDSSRVVQAKTGSNGQSTERLLLAVIADRLGHIAWMFGEDGRSGQNHPPSILATITGAETPAADGYDTGDDFMAAWVAITGGEADA